MMAPRSVVIIGGGFSGALQAVNLLRHDGPRATLIERRPQAGQGVAYSTSHPGHLLNVRTANMSAFPDEPDHFVHWLARRGEGDRRAFVPRSLYGSYLAELVEQARRQFPGRLDLVHGDAVDLELTDGVAVRLSDGRVVQGDTAVLALGNPPTAVPDRIDPAELGSRYVGDPWSPAATAGLTAADHVLILGTGLTMVDMVLLLDAHGFDGQVTALSRRGLLPHRQGTDGAAGAVLAQRPAGELSELLHRLRARSQAVGWHAAVDELRPFTQAMWQAATPVQQKRFLRHLRPWWDVHRHRMAPAAADRIDTLIRAGRLRIAAGRTQTFTPRDAGVDVAWRPRGKGDAEALTVSRIINCSGAQSDLLRTDEPLLVRLIEQGVIAPDALGLGLSVDAQGRLRDVTGHADRRLYALGPLTRGTFWEITAVPDIRVQTWNVARYLSNAHWIEGHGL